MIKVNVLEYYEKISAPPLDVKDAYARLDCAADLQHCNSDKLYKSLNAEFARIGKLNMTLSQPTANTMQKLDAEAIKKKMESMTRDEKIKYTPFQTKLAAVNYGEDAKSYSNKTSLLAGQTLMLGAAESLAGWSQTSTDEAAHWWLEKLRLDKEKQ